MQVVIRVRGRTIDDTRFLVTEHTGVKIPTHPCGCFPDAHANIYRIVPIGEQSPILHVVQGGPESARFVCPKCDTVTTLMILKNSIMQSEVMENHDT